MNQIVKELGWGVKIMRIFKLELLIFSLIVWSACDQNLLPLPDNPNQNSIQSSLSQATKPDESKKVIISGMIDIDPKLFMRLRGSETLYITARRGQNGPPVAVRRMKQLQFPIPYTLTSDDQMVKGQAFKGEVSVVARIDLDGNAGLPQTGDMEGIIRQVLIGTDNADVTIDKLY